MPLPYVVPYTGGVRKTSVYLQGGAFTILPAGGN
jgi:hypothetical protein